MTISDGSCHSATQSPMKTNVSAHNRHLIVLNIKVRFAPPEAFKEKEPITLCLNTACEPTFRQYTYHHDQIR